MKFFSQDILKSARELQREIDETQMRVLAATRQAAYRLAVEMERRPAISLSLVFIVMAVTRPHRPAQAISAEFDSVA